MVLETRLSGHKLHWIQSFVFYISRCVKWTFVCVCVVCVHVEQDVWLCVCVHVCVEQDVWLCVCVHVCMEQDVWLCVCLSVGESWFTALMRLDRKKSGNTSAANKGRVTSLIKFRTSVQTKNSFGRTFWWMHLVVYSVWNLKNPENKISGLKSAPPTVYWQKWVSGEEGNERSTSATLILWSPIMLHLISFLRLSSDSYWSDAWGNQNQHKQTALASSFTLWRHSVDCTIYKWWMHWPWKP